MLAPEPGKRGADGEKRPEHHDNVICARNCFGALAGRSDIALETGQLHSVSLDALRKNFRRYGSIAIKACDDPLGKRVAKNGDDAVDILVSENAANSDFPSRDRSKLRRQRLKKYSR